MIDINNLSKSFDNSFILKNINLTVPRGCIFGILGKSGSGKSTLLRCINGLESIDTGSIRICGTEISNMTNHDLRKTRKDIGMIFQSFSLIDRISVANNIAAPMKIWKYPKTDINKRVDELLELVDLRDKKDIRARDLSGGQMQRIAIARALSTDPDIILSDESTSSLDPASTETIVETLRNINEEYNKTILLVSHEMEVIKALCDYVAIIEDSEIAYISSTEKLFFDYPKSLKKLTGYNKQHSTPENRRLYHIKLKGDTSNSNAIFQLLSDVNIDLKIEKLYSDILKKAKIHNFIISINRVDSVCFENFLKHNELTYELI